MKTSFFQNFLPVIQKHKKILLWLFWGVFFIFLVSMLWFFWGNFYGNFQVSWANFDLISGKIPYNTKSIDFTLSQDISTASLDSKALIITPHIEGNLLIKNKNTLSFVLKEPLVLWEDYQIFLANTITDSHGKTLWDDIFYLLKASEEARVLKVIPEWEIQNLWKNIWVFFNMPMVPLTSIGKSKDLPCPIEITPAISGECQWTSSSILEFIPKNWLVWATQYTLKIINVPGLNYELLHTPTHTFTTPDLTFTIPETFLPSQWIELNFNFPLDQASLEKHLTLNNSPAKITSVAWSQTDFILHPQDDHFYYSQNFVVTIEKWLKTLYGNIPTKTTVSKNIASTDFVSHVEVYQNIFSQTGSIIDTRMLDIWNQEYQLKHIPNNNVFFKIHFHEEVSLKKDLFSVSSSQGEKIPFEIKYGHIEDENKNLSLDKKTVILTLSNPLKTHTAYTLSLSKNGNPSLLSDTVIFSPTTSAELKVEKFLFLDNSRSCLYLNNKLDCLYGECQDIKENFSLSQSGIIRNISGYQYIDWELEQQAKSLNEPQKSQFLQKNGYCPYPKNNEYLYVIDTRLTPQTPYKLSIKNLKDTYGNVLAKDMSANFTTKELKNSDIYIYSHLSNFVNVFPKQAPLNINIQTINTEKVFAEVCEMTQTAYEKYYANIYNENNIPECTKRTIKELPTKNVYWKLQNNVFNIEKDIIHAPLTQNYVLFQVFSDASLSKKLSHSSHMLVRTNLNLFLEKATNTSIIFASDINNGKIISDLSFEWRDFEKNKIDIPATFNTKKQAYEIKTDLSNIAFLSAKNKNYEGIISNDDYFGNYDFKYISGLDSSVKNYLYTYTDRPIYRPGDEVFIKWILREFRIDGYKKSSHTWGLLKIYGENNTLYQTLRVEIDKNSNFSTHFQIPKESTLGMFEFQFFPDTLKNGWNEMPIYSYGNFFIEEYKKPTFKIDITSPNTDLIEGMKADFSLEPKYYFWGKITNTQGKMTLLKQNYFFDGKEFSDFQFWNGSEYFDCVYWGYCNYNDGFVEEKSFKIDENGKYHFEYDFTWDESAEKIYNFQFEITDPNTQKPVTKSVSKVLHSTDGYVGLKVPYFHTLSSGISLEAITLDHNAKIKANTPLTLEIIKRDWKNVKKLWVDGIYYNDYALKESKVASANLKTNSQWILTHTFTSLKSGEYEIKATYTGTNKKSFTSSSIVYVAWEEFISWRNDNNTITEFEPLKSQYNVGETAKFILKSPINSGKALVLVEKDDGILDYFFHDIKSYGDVIEYKIHDAHYPNVYFKVFLIGHQKDNLLPIYKRALSTVKVMTDYKKLNVSITPEKKYYRPWEKVHLTVQVRDTTGKWIPLANGSLWVVDQSVLALKGNPVKNPYAFFYEMKRYLWVVSWSNLKYLVETLSIKDISGWEKWGSWDQLKGWTPKKERGIFKDTAFFVADFTTDTNGIAKITIDALPDNLTTWVVEAVINTSDTKIGVGYETFITNTPVMIEDNLPRFFGGDDSLSVKPIVYNKTEKDSEFEVKLTINDTLLSKKTVFIKKDESLWVPFFLDIKDSHNIKKNEIIKVNFSAISQKDPSQTDSITKYIPLKESYIPQYIATSGKVTDTGLDEKIDLWGTFSPQGNINFSPTLFPSLLDDIETLDPSNMFWAQEKTSFVKSIFIVKNLYESAGISYDLKKHFKEIYIDAENGNKKVSLDALIWQYLIEIKKYQNTDGGFSYWNEGNFRTSDFELTGYILSTISHLQSLWYDFDKKTLSLWEQYLKDQVINLPTCGFDSYENCLSLGAKIQVLWDLLTYDTHDYEVFKIFKTLENALSKENEKIRSLELLTQIEKIDTLSLAEKEMIQTLVKNDIEYLLKNHLVISPKWAFISLNNADSRFENTAKFLKILADSSYAERKNISGIEDNMVRFLLKYKNTSHLSPSEMLSGFEALWSYVDQTFLPEQTNFQTNIFFNSTKIASKSFSKKDNFTSWNTKIPWNLLKEKNTLNFSLSGSGNLYYDVNVKYFVPYAQQTAIDRGFFIKREYFSYDDFIKIKRLKDAEYASYLSGEITYDKIIYKKPVVSYLKPVTSGKIWDLLLVHNAIYTNEPRDHVFFEGFIPSGSELVNTRLDTETQIQTLDENIIFDREELRDDAYIWNLHFLESGIYDVSYTIRLTHAGKFHVKPSTMSELYDPEVFGSTPGNILLVQ